MSASDAPALRNQPQRELPTEAAEAAEAAVSMRGIVKRYGPLTAVGDVDLDLAAGEVHALVGENGAGKSTLMQILAGVTSMDAGRIRVRGRDAAIRGVGDAHRLGIAMVHQHFMLFPSLTVAENLTIGKEPRRRLLVDRAAARRTVTELSERFGLTVDPDARVRDLGVGALQRVEILRALLRGADILILDEPTAVLTPQESERLFGVTRNLAAQGRTVVFVSHRLEEVISHATRITVLRDGRVTARLAAAETDIRELARAMVGRDVVLRLERHETEPGRTVLELRGVSAPGLHDVDLHVRAGEIVGVAGVAGNGQSELADVISGVVRATRGSIEVDGRDVTGASVAARRVAGLAYIPDDRFRVGLAGDASIRDNLIMGRHAGKAGQRRRLLDRAGIARRVERVVGAFRIPADRLDSPARTLSGGNAQRVVLGRELADPHPVTLAAQPTRGIDVAATEFVRRALLDRRSTGSGLLLVSADLDEIRGLSDRIVVLHRGRIVGELTAEEADDTTLGLLMAGVTGTPGTRGPGRPGSVGSAAVAGAPEAVVGAPEDIDGSR
ncbi:MAG: ral nucleoside transport system ATP-binding protein [Chloroflexota bacterium]|jgi:simple sugar transport system ATP-binding protein|nr:ral nucleoside transport system ATP-binding protein [Chloroflexota bacterium]